MGRIAQYYEPLEIKKGNSLGRRMGVGCSPKGEEREELKKSNDLMKIE